MVDVWNWSATAEETGEPLPCDDYVIRPYRSMHRTVDVEAPLSVRTS
jgi:hypothetical protein